MSNPGRHSPSRKQFGLGLGRHDRNNPHHVQRPGGTDCWLLEYAIAGSAFVQMGDRRWALREGEMLLYKPGTPQDYGMDENIGYWDHIWACFIPPATWLELLEWPVLIPGLMHLSLPPNSRAHVQSQLDSARLHMHRSWERKKMFAMNLLESVFLWCDRSNPVRAKAQMDPRLRAVLEHIYLDYARAQRLTKLSELVGLSPSRLSQLFKKHLGLSPAKFLERIRLDRAEELLLANERRTLAEIAEGIGFSNAFHLSSVFKRRRGLSPKAFRQKSES